MSKSLKDKVSDQESAFWVKLNRGQGLATGVHRTDLDNVAVIRVILFAYENNMQLECANRNEDNWTNVWCCPMDFLNYRYRIKP